MFMSALDGKKTYIGCAAQAVTVAAWHFGWIDGDTALAITGLIAAWTGVSLRLAIKKASG